MDRETSPFKDLKVMVCGDVCIDIYLRGISNRQSPEFPVPVINDVRSEYRLGMAGNVWNNLIALGAQAELFSVLGPLHSAASRWIRGQCGLLGHFFADANRMTSEKIRLVSNGTHLARIDNETRKPLTLGDGREFLDLLKKNLSRFDAVILQDYNKGLWTKQTLQIIQYAKEYEIPVFVDPGFGRKLSLYKDSTLIKLNLKEAQAASPVDYGITLVSLAKILRKQTNADYLVVTLADQGMCCVGRDNKYIEAVQKKIKAVDVCGAGDTALSVLCLELLKNTSVATSMRVANKAAGLVVQKPGTSVVSWKELYG